MLFAIASTPTLTWRPSLQRGFRFQEDGALSQTVVKSAKVVPVLMDHILPAITFIQ